MIHVHLRLFLRKKYIQLLRDDHHAVPKVVPIAIQTCPKFSRKVTISRSQEINDFLVDLL